MLKELCLFAAILGLAVGRKLGAPNAACSDMTPGHGSAPQQSSSPYTLTLSKKTYRAGEVIEGTLRGDSFKGFLIEPRVADKSYTTVGSLAPVSTGMQNHCSPEASLTHTNNTEKTSVQFRWTAPAQDSGDVVFVFSVVKTFTTYWVKVVGPTLSFVDDNGHVVG